MDLAAELHTAIKNFFSDDLAENKGQSGRYATHENALCRGAASEEGLAVATASDGSVYIAGTATSFGPSSSGLFVDKFDSAGNLVWQKMSDGAAGNAVAVASTAAFTPRAPLPDQVK
jgi:hypothetical protein